MKISLCVGGKGGKYYLPMNERSRMFYFFGGASVLAPISVLDALGRR
jgi:hypothetical protein